MLSSIASVVGNILCLRDSAVTSIFTLKNKWIATTTPNLFHLPSIMPLSSLASFPELNEFQEENCPDSQSISDYTCSICISPLLNHTTSTTVAHPLCTLEICFPFWSLLGLAQHVQVRAAMVPSFFRSVRHLRFNELNRTDVELPPELSETNRRQPILDTICELILSLGMNLLFLYSFYYYLLYMFSFTVLCCYNLLYLHIVLDLDLDVRSTAADSIIWLINPGGHTGPMVALFHPDHNRNNKIGEELSSNEDLNGKLMELAIQNFVERIQAKLNLQDEDLDTVVTDNVLIVVTQFHTFCSYDIYIYIYT